MTDEKSATGDRDALVRKHQQKFTKRQQVLIWSLVGVLMVVLSLMPQGSGEGKLHGGETFDAESGEYVFTETTGWLPATAMWTGAIAAYILLFSPLTGHRPLLRRWLGGRAWRRTHMSVGISILVFSAIHAVALLWFQAYHTWPSGTAAFAILAIHGATAAFKTSLINRWGAGRWQTIHVATGWLGLVVGMQHALGMNAAAHLWQSY